MVDKAGEISAKNAGKTSEQKETQSRYCLSFIKMRSFYPVLCGKATFAGKNLSKAAATAKNGTLATAISANLCAI